MNQTASKRISGKKFAIGFAIVLAVCVLVGVPVVLRFVNIQNQREAVLQAWPEAADSFGKYYAAIDEELSKEPETAAIRTFRDSYKDFLKSSSFESQVKQLGDVEKALSAPDVSMWLPTKPMLPRLRRETFGSPSVASYLEKEASLRRIDRDWLGSTTRFLLRLKPTPGLDVSG